MLKISGVIIMDIVGSRKIENREFIQNKLEAFILELNEKYRKILVTPSRFTLGDEWQLITSQPDECYNFVQEFQQFLWPYNINIYAGIGVGYISTGVKNDIGAMDGSCFIQARKAINIAKIGSRKYIHNKQCKVFFSSADEIHNNINWQDKSEFNYLDEVAATMSPSTSPTFDNIINVLIENNEILKSKMTEKQKLTFIDYENAGTYRKMVNSNGYHLSGISAKLNSANYFTIKNNSYIIKNLLYNYYKLGEGETWD